MIRKKDDCTIELKEHMRDGDGTVQITNFVKAPEELNGKGRLFARLHLEPGVSIGPHVHEGEAELFYIMNGTAEYNNNGVPTQITAGDVTICRAGEQHGIRNVGDGPLDVIAVIVYA